MSGDSSEKTEDATPKKLREARKRGQVPTSKDIPSALILILATIYFWMNWDNMSASLQELFDAVADLMQVSFPQALQASLTLVMEKAVYEIALPFAGIAIAAGILGNIVQFGFIFSFDPVIPKISKINPTDGFKRIFSIKQMVQTLLSLVKTIIIAIVMFYIIYTGMKMLLNETSQCDLLCQKSIVEDLISQMFMLVIPLILVLAILDFIFQHTQFMKEQRMTKEEIKREFKEMFGDPHLMGARRGLRRELAESDVKERIKAARLVVVDIGVAIALHFVQGETPLPIITAIGKGPMARKMMEIAQIEGIPVMEDPRLADLLVEEGKIDQFIPSSSIDQVAQAMRQNPKG